MQKDILQLIQTERYVYKMVLIKAYHFLIQETKKYIKELQRKIHIKLILTIP